MYCLGYWEVICYTWAIPKIDLKKKQARIKVYKQFYLMEKIDLRSMDYLLRV